VLRAWVGTFLSLAGVACGLTWLYLGMRSVMEIGGACASGGPYEVAHGRRDGVVSRLERLAALRDRGALDPDEYE
jgi:hypothetical protein